MNNVVTLRDAIIQAVRIHNNVPDWQPDSLLMDLFDMDARFVISHLGAREEWQVAMEGVPENNRLIVNGVVFTINMNGNLSRLWTDVDDGGS